MYFDFRTYRRVFARALREPDHPRRRKIVWALAVLFPLLALWDAFFFALDHVLYPGFRRVEIRTPVFIVGNARSGTTHIHRLLSADERFSYFRTWQILLPSIVQKKIVAAIAGLDRRWLGSALERRLVRRQDAALGKARRMHDWRLDGAEEDGFLHLHTFGSATLSVLFPYNPMLEALGDLDEKATPAERRRQLRFYEGCVRRQLYFDGGDRILLSKNPAFVTRMRSLLERFPDLLFVCPVRHPYETIPSLIDMLQKGWLAMGADPRDVEESVAWLRQSGIESYRRAFEVLDELPPDRSFVPAFGDLVERPKATVEALYERFGWKMTAEVARFLDREQERARAYVSAHHYDPGLGPSRETLHAALGPLFERFGWEKESEASSRGA